MHAPDCHLFAVKKQRSYSQSRVMAYYHSVATGISHVNDCSHSYFHFHDTMMHKAGHALRKSN